jgi:hypothetical protein
MHVHEVVLSTCHPSCCTATALTGPCGEPMERLAISLPGAGRVRTSKSGMGVAEQTPIRRSISSDPARMAARVVGLSPAVPS